MSTNVDIRRENEDIDIVIVRGQRKPAIVISRDIAPHDKRPNASHHDFDVEVIKYNEAA